MSPFVTLPARASRPSESTHLRPHLRTLNAADTRDMVRPVRGRRAKAKPGGIVLWEGFSPIDGAPIVAIATGLSRPSSNRKTGPMVQVWILRADVSPSEAVATDADASVCGSCPLKGLGFKKRACYVNVGQAPAAVWRAYQRGSYPRVTLQAARDLIEGRALRLGAYGDPAMVPARFLKAWTQAAKSHTGYTHQWRAPFATDAHRELLMASADTAEDRAEALARGWRFFGITTTPDDVESAIECPADRGLTTCEKCGLCAGTSKRAKSIVIRAHGAGAQYVPV